MGVRYEYDQRKCCLALSRTQSPLRRVWHTTHLDDLRPGQYLGYFENDYGEQALFVYDRDSRQAILYLGDAGWQTRHVVVDGGVPDLVLSETERLWVGACWQAATANRKEACR